MRNPLRRPAVIMSTPTTALRQRCANWTALPLHLQFAHEQSHGDEYEEYAEDYIGPRGQDENEDAEDEGNDSCSLPLHVPPPPLNAVSASIMRTASRVCNGWVAAFGLKEQRGDMAVALP